MHITEPTVVILDGFAQYSVNVYSQTGNHTLWFSVKEEHAELLTEGSEPAAVALLIHSMYHREDLVIDGLLSERLLYHLASPLQDVLQRIIPSLAPIRVSAPSVRVSPSRPGGVATGFSAGVDSWSVLLDHYFHQQFSGFRLTHLVCNNIWEHCENGSETFRGFENSLRQISKKIGLPLVAIDSNIRSFYPTFSWGKIHSIINAAYAHLLNNGVGRYMYASGVPYYDTFVGEASTGYSDPITLPMLCSETMDIISVGGQYTRVEKTRAIAQHSLTYGNLHVCVRGGGSNCSACEKCMRTMLTLELLGYLKNYEGVFDLSVYRAMRPRYIAELCLKGGAFSKEIHSLAREVGIPLFPSFRGLSALTARKIAQVFRCVD